MSQSEKGVKSKVGLKAAEPIDGVHQKQLALVYNPSSNAWLHYAQNKDAEQFLKQLLDPLELNYQLVAFDGKSLKELPSKLKEMGAEMIWVAGGDGTILAVAEIAQQLELPMGVIPAGTMNLMARDLGMDLDLTKAIKQLVDAPVTQIDVGMMNDKPFLCISNLGLSTDFSHQREKLRHAPAIARWPAVTWHTMQALFNYPNLNVVIEANGRSWRVKSRAISISNNRLCDRASLFPCRDTLDAGELAIYVTKETSIWSLPRLYSKLMMGNWQHDPEMLVIHTKEAVFRLPKKRKVRVMTDGELSMEKTPLHYKIHTRCLDVFKPVKPETDAPKEGL